jgi:hypothetical protein
MGKKLFNTKKQKALLQILANPEFRSSTVEQICRAAGISVQYYYQLRTNPAFIDAVYRYCAGLCISSAPQILQKFAELGKQGQFKHGELVLKVANIVKEVPLVQQVIANLSRMGMTETELDQKLAQYFTKHQDITDAEVVNTTQPEGTQGDKP